MKLMKRILFAFCLIFFVTGGAIFPAKAQITKGMTCPVMPGEAVKKKFYVDYKGERIYLCCRNCVKAFKKNPEKFLAIIKNVKASNLQGET